MDLPHHNPSCRQGLHENCVPDDKIFSSICSLRRSNTQTTRQGKKHTCTMYFLTLLGHLITILLLFFPSIHVYRRPTCVCDEHVCSRIMIVVAGDMIMIAALLLHNNNLGRGGVVVYRTRGCTCMPPPAVPGTWLYTRLLLLRNLMQGRPPYDRKIPGLHVLQVLKLIDCPQPHHQIYMLFHKSVPMFTSCHYNGKNCFV